MPKSKFACFQKKRAKVIFLKCEILRQELRRRTFHLCEKEAKMKAAPLRQLKSKSKAGRRRLHVDVLAIIKNAIFYISISAQNFIKFGIQP